MDEGKTLYLECRSGISGDMTVAALLDLGATEKNLRETLAKIPVDGYEIRVSRVVKNSLNVCDFDVICDPEEETHGGREHEEGHHGHAHHTHVHRTWKDIEAMLDAADLKPEVRRLSKEMFRTVAEAEGRVHGKSPEEVHFHEVGAVDSIVDIVGTAACLEELGVRRILVSDLSEGYGHVRCQHGTLPVPVPAVLEIASANGLVLRQTDQEGEMVTPTGAAIAALSKGARPGGFRVNKVGMGAGKKEFRNANILRAMLIEEEDEEKSVLCVLESNIDDSDGEKLGYAMERLMEAGARDVWYTPIYMKKNRPACKLSVLCDAPLIETMNGIIFRETSSIGVRRFPVKREELGRRFETVLTPYGPVDMKVCTLPGGEERYYPEYESAKKAALEHGAPLCDVQRAAVEVAAGAGGVL